MGRSTNPQPATVTNDTPIVDSFDDLVSWETTVRINTHPTDYCVGASTNHDEYRLYDPSDGYTYVGDIRLDRRVARDKPARVLVDWSGRDGDGDGDGDGDDEDTQPSVVYSMGVSTDDRTAILDDVLTDIRSSLTNTDWSVDNPQTSYDQQMKATVSLMDYYSEEYDGDRIAVDVNELSIPELEMALFRYKKDAKTTLSLISLGVVDRRETTTTPVAVRELLLDYYVDKIE